MLTLPSARLLRDGGQAAGHPGAPRRAVRHGTCRGRDTRVGHRGVHRVAEYDAAALSDAGYEVTIDEFTFPYFNETAPLELTVVGGATFVGGEHLRALIFSRSGNLEAPVVTVAPTRMADLSVRGGASGRTGRTFPRPVHRARRTGPCFRRQMVEEAQTPGAVP